jgi:hypothetical protein
MVRRLIQKCSGSAQTCSDLLRLYSGMLTKTEVAKGKINPESGYTSKVESDV